MTRARGCGRSRLWDVLAPWLLGALAATAMFAALALISHFRYENSDDLLLVKSFMGFEGAPASFMLYTHTLLVWLMNALCSLISPSIAWLSLFQMALLWFSSTVIVKSLAQIARARGLHMLWGALAGLVFLALFAAFASCRVTYTTTAALAGAAAVAQFMCIDHQSAKRGAIYRGFALSLALLVCCLILRELAVLPPLCFMLLAMGYRAWAAYGFGKKRAIKPLIVCACALAVALGGLTTLRQADIDAQGQRDFMRWHDARTKLFDYTPFEQDIEPALAADAGLSEPELTLLGEWYFMDSGFTAETLDAYREAYDGVAQESAFSRVGGLFKQPRYLCSLVVMGLLLALCLLAAKQKGAPYALASLLCALGGTALLFYMAYRGRLLGRSADTVLFPCAALLMALALEGLGGLFARDAAKGDDESPTPAKPAPIRRYVAMALCLCCLAATAVGALATKKAISGKPDTVSMQREAKLEAYALAHPDLLLVRTPNLLRDTRLMPDVSAGVPGNIIIWGDWYCKTPSWNAQIERYGFDPARFTATDWLKESIAFVTADDMPPQALTDYIAEAAGSAVTPTLTDEYGTLRIFQFQAR